MKITKEYLTKLIKESIKEEFQHGDETSTAYVIVDEGSYHPAQPQVVLNDLEKAKQIADQMSIDAEDEHETHVVVYEMMLSGEKKVAVFPNRPGYSD